MTKIRRFFRKILLALILIVCVSSYLLGVKNGYHLGKETICDDIHFYYHDDLPVKGCATNLLK